jgi:hypothetical protein
VNQYWQHVRPFAQRNRNPLWRSVDLTEARAMTALAVLAVCACVVLGVLAGHRADSLGRAEQRAERGWRPAVATLQQSAAQSTTDTSGSEVAWVPARWQLPDGQHRSGQVATELDARAGQKVMIWVNSVGQQTRPPVTSAGVWDLVFATVLSLVMAIAIVAGIAAGSIRLLCNRRRMVGWHRAWDAIGPTWSRHA